MRSSFLYRANLHSVYHRICKIKCPALWRRTEDRVEKNKKKKYANYSARNISTAPFNAGHIDSESMHSSSLNVQTGRLYLSLKKSKPAPMAPVNGLAAGKCGRSFRQEGQAYEGSHESYYNYDYKSSDEPMCRRLLSIFGFGIIRFIFSHNRHVCPSSYQFQKRAPLVVIHPQLRFATFTTVYMCVTAAEAPASWAPCAQLRAKNPPNG